MQNEVVRIVADWLADATYGVNAYAATVPRDAGDAAPPEVTVIDQTRDPKAARERNAAKEDAEDPGWEVAVALADPIETAWATTTDADADAIGLFIGIKGRQDESDLAVQHLNYLTRATRRSLAELFTNANELSRRRNSVHLVGLPRVRHHAPESGGDEQIMGGLDVTIVARDYAPYY